MSSAQRRPRPTAPVPNPRCPLYPLIASAPPRPQEAYEVLSDPAKRREYDSTDEFDDTLPTGCDPADFFKVGRPGVGAVWR
jgi:hypothetical protein